MISHRPCGVCRALVPADTGCKHYRPAKAGEDAAAVKRRERNRLSKERARANAKAAVDEFRRQQGVGT